MEKTKNRWGARLPDATPFSRPKPSTEKKGLNAYSLAGVGIGGVIGAGFFLGSGLAVHEAGPSVMVAFLLGGLIMMQVLGAMTSINANRLAHGSFRVYAEQFLGRYVGFLLGWAVFTSLILGIGSEAIAMGVFVRYWLPHWPLSIISMFFTLVVVGLNALGIQNFGRLETGMAVLKTIALLMFIVIGCVAIFAYGYTVTPHPLQSVQSFLPNGFSGLLRSMLIVIFSFSGIGAVAMAASEVQRPKREIPLAVVMMTIGVLLVYVLSMYVLVHIVSWQAVYTNKSPFVQALDAIGTHWASTGLNVVILLAAFSVMAASYYAAIQMLTSLTESQEAPGFFGYRTKKGLYRNAWLAVGIAVVAVVGLSFLLPPNLYNYLVSASSYFTFLNWSINLITFSVWLKKRKEGETYVSKLVFGRPGAYVTLAAILVLTVMSLRVHDFRMGFYAAAVILLVVSLAYLFWRRTRHMGRRPVPTEEG